MMMFDKPISMEELTDAADEFFPKYDFIRSRLPKNATASDIIKVLELVSIQAYKKRMCINNAKMSVIKGGKNK